MVVPALTCTRPKSVHTDGVWKLPSWAALPTRGLRQSQSSNGLGEIHNDDPQVTIQDEDDVGTLVTGLIRGLSGRTRNPAPLIHWSRLPSEVWQDLFLLLDRPSLIRVTHTCRIFRSLALDYPRLWSTLENRYQTYEELAAFLERSRETSLIVLATCDASDIDARLACATPFFDFMQLVAPYAVRWESFAFTFNAVGSKEEVPPELFSAVDCGNLDLPRLRQLSVDCGPEFEFFCLYTCSWKTPRLDGFTCRNALLPWISGETISFFSLDFAPQTVTFVNLRNLLNCLEFLPELISLSLRFENFNESDPQISVSEEVEALYSDYARLSKLEDLELKIIGSSNRKHLESFMRALETPVLSFLELYLSTPNACNWVRALIPANAAEAWPALESVNVIDTYRDVGADVDSGLTGQTLFTALIRLPHVRRLYYESLYVPLLTSKAYLNFNFSGIPTQATGATSRPQLFPNLKRLILRHTEERCIAHCASNPEEPACMHESATCAYVSWFLRNTSVQMLELQCIDLAAQTVQRLTKIGGNRVRVWVPESESESESSCFESSPIHSSLL